jgi:hypothetical protein
VGIIGNLLEYMHFTQGSVNYYEFKHQKPWFDERFSKLLAQRIEARLQWIQDLSQFKWKQCE